MVKFLVKYKNNSKAYVITNENKRIAFTFRSVNLKLLLRRKNL